MLFTTGASPRQGSHSRVRVPRDSWPHFTVSDSTVPQPGGPGPRIYIPKEQGSPVIPPGTGFPFRRLLRLAGIRWRYPNWPQLACSPCYTTSGQINRKHLFLKILSLLLSYLLPREMCLLGRCLAMNVCLFVYFIATDSHATIYCLRRSPGMEGSSRGQPTSDGPSAWGLGVWLTVLHLENYFVSKCHKGPYLYIM
jgi:hypothetical protein